MNYPVPMHAPLIRQPDPAEILAPLGLPLTPAVSAFARDLAPADDDRLEEMARRSRAMTRRHFGRTVRLFAPLYLSNECINSCSYCGFSRENAILRVTLEAGQVRAEARHLAAQGFRNILLVDGEHPKFVSNGYLEKVLRTHAHCRTEKGLRLAAGLPGTRARRRFPTYRHRGAFRIVGLARRGHRPRRPS